MHVVTCPECDVKFCFKVFNDTVFFLQSQELHASFLTYKVIFSELDHLCEFNKQAFSLFIRAESQFRACYLFVFTKKPRIAMYNTGINSTLITARILLESLLGQSDESN